MWGKIFFVGLVVAFSMPAFVAADNADAYAKCQNTCFGNGLSCVKECMANSSQGNAGAPAPSSPVAIEVDEDNGYLGDSNLTPAEKRRLQEQRGADLQPGTPNVPRNLPATRPFVGGRR